MDGFINLYRQLLDSPVWAQATPKRKVILITILLMASYKDKAWIYQGKQHKLRPGQFKTSYERLANRANGEVSGKEKITVQNVRSALDYFKKFDFSTYKSTGDGLIITVLNWQTYQDTQKKINTPPNSEPTTINNDIYNIYQHRLKEFMLKRSNGIVNQQFSSMTPFTVEQTKHAFEEWVNKQIEAGEKFTETRLRGTFVKFMKNANSAGKQQHQQKYQKNYQQQNVWRPKSKTLGI